MKILLINPPFIKDFCRCQRWPARTRGRALRMPDWLGYAAAVLEQDGFYTELYDCIAQGYDKEDFRRLIRAQQPDFVVLDSSTPSIYSDIECAGICKQESRSRTVVIMVGTHASALPEETLRDAKGNVDVIALGEYDYTIRDLIRRWPDVREVPGLCFLRENGARRTGAWDGIRRSRAAEGGEAKADKPQRTPSRPFIENLDALPFPSRKNLKITNYFDAGRLYPYINVIGGRGCPFRCSFCQWPQIMFGHAYRFRSPRNICDEIESDLKLFPLLRYGEFFFEDDTFTVNKERALGICEEMFRRNLKITWSANARPDIYDTGLFKTMKRAGCRELLVGFESGSQAILDKVKKGLNLRESKEFVITAKKTGIDVHGCFVLGLPGETKQTAETTIEFALKLGVNTLQFSAAVPLPGSEYFNYCKTEGLLRTRSWEDWLDAGEQSAVVEYPGLSIQEINTLVNTGLKKFYFRPRFLFKFAFVHRNIFDFYRKCRGGINFLSYLLNR
jgi:radical SAM superfamily enzyme YgiQ (UPF0313 family)